MTARVCVGAEGPFVISDHHHRDSTEVDCRIVTGSWPTIAPTDPHPSLSEDHFRLKGGDIWIHVASGR